MDIASFSSVQLIIVLGICILLFLQKKAIKKEYFVKVEYSKPKRLFWAVLTSSIIASNSIIFEDMFFVLLAFVIGLYLYFFKQYYVVNPK